MTKNTLEKLETLAFNLDDEMGAIGCEAIAIRDIRTLIGNLRVKLDNIDEKNVSFFFNELHREIRVLDELSNSAAQRLSEYHGSARDINQEIVDITVSLKNDNLQISPLKLAK